MTMHPEHKPHPWGQIASENAKAANFGPDPRLTGHDPAFDADVLRVITDLDPWKIAQFAMPAEPNVVIRLLAQPIPPKRGGGEAQGG